MDQVSIRRLQLDYIKIPILCDNTSAINLVKYPIQQDQNI